MLYFVIDKNNIIVNIITWDGVSKYNPGKGFKIVDFIKGKTIGDKI